MAEGLKEIFVYSKGKEANEQLVRKMNEMKDKKVVENVLSLTAFIKSRKDAKE